ncbi:Notch ligand involved in the mediation of Notch signaling (By similarity) [Seminavis robusta]|uniref:Notch ligand involved in the mediation of Notch signaling By similarity n=1 Tax=Seminavis robusta TaxID=568900 RepID=A0A9N8EGZ4_9STRA|nr:Notch ligand involved in the mediation of Notch signaling (By similarity) [Seminavis robusta]|eukprot:Sro980_g227410.1 Notch ligand involved in the mediation of Notch signaling (By similarity) (817) ;mRNA; f:24073-26676
MMNNNGNNRVVNASIRAEDTPKEADVHSQLKEQASQVDGSAHGLGILCDSEADDQNTVKPELDEAVGNLGKNESKECSDAEEGEAVKSDALSKSLLEEKVSAEEEETGLTAAASDPKSLDVEAAIVPEDEGNALLSQSRKDAAGKKECKRGPERIDKNLGVDEQDYVDSFKNREGEREQVLNEDIYSVIYTADARSQAFCFAMFVFVVQLSVIWLIFFDLLDTHSDNNKISLPPGVPIMVNLAQAIGVLLIVFTVAVYGDLTTGLARLIDGYDSDVLFKHPDAHCTKWFLSGLFQMTVGASMTMVLFVLLMQSTTVIGMCLNFAALHFVQEIDDLSFALGQKGFLTRSIQKDCDHVSQLTVPKGRRRVRKRARRIFTAALTVALYIPYFVLVSRQWRGDYVCRNLYVQFGDAYLPELAYFSGRYTIASVDLVNSVRTRTEFRPVYFDSSEQLRLAYCGQESAWVFSLRNATDHCDFIVKSSPTTAFDVASLKGSTWYSYNYETENVVPADWFFIGCNDCVRDETQCTDDAGICLNTGACVCHPGRMGINCQFPDPTCDTLTLDARTDPLPLEEGVTFPESYGLYRLPGEKEKVFELNNHPAYLSKFQKAGVKNTTDFMFFTGRRWVIFSARQPGETIPESTSSSQTHPALPNRYAEMLIAKLFERIPNETHSIENADEFVWYYRPYFFSEPVDFGTPSDVLEPLGLNWFRAVHQHHGLGFDGWVTDESQPLQTNFICAECNDRTNPCYNDFQCENSTETCLCDEFYQGALCEHPLRCDQQPCHNNGTCDAWKGYCECPSPFYGSLCQYKPLFLPLT